MDFFNILIKRFFYKIPLKLLLFIIIIILCILCLKSNVFATTISSFDYNNVTYNLYIPTNAWGVIQQLPEFNSSSYDYLFYCSGGQCYIYFWSNTLTQHFYNDITSSPSNYGRFYHTNNNISCRFYQITENGTSVPSSYTEVSSSQMGIQAYGDDSRRRAYYFTNLPVFTDSTLTTTFWEGLAPQFIAPYFLDSSSISDMSFTYLTIEGGSEDFYTNVSNISRQRIFDLELDYQGYTYTMNINDYAILAQDGNSVSFAIPKYALFPQLIFRNGEQVSFSLIVTPSKSPNSSGNWSSYGLGSFTLSLTTAQEEQLIEDRQAQQMDNIESGVNNINNSLNNVNTSISSLTNDIIDSNVDNDITSDFSDLSSGFEIEDVSGLEQVFEKLYNAFCTDSVINLTFTIPFVNKSVTISSANISSFYPSSVKSIVSVFVWGIIGLWVLKDVRSSVNKIAEGKAEDVGSDVKKEVL